MSRLILKGDLIKNFGEYYPIPYIDEVTIYDIGTKGSTGMTINHSFLFLAPEMEPSVPGSDIRVLLSAVENLNFYFLLAKTLSKDDPRRAIAEVFNASAVTAYANAAGASTIPGMELPSGTSTATLPDTPARAIPGVEDSLDELSLLLYDSSLLVEFLKNATPYSFGGAPSGYEIIEINKESIFNKISSGEYVELYDMQGRRIIKVNGQEQITLVPPPEYGLFPDTLGINLLAFSSLLSQNEFEASQLTTNAALSVYVGDIAYETILEDNVVPNQTEISFFNPDGQIAMETPLQAISGKYYETSMQTRSTMTQKFNQLLEGYETLVGTGENTDNALQSNIDSIKYALQVYADSAELLTRINAARRSFVEKSSGTTSGALFGDLRRLIRTTNRELKVFPELTKKLTVNSKIIDTRNQFISGYVLPTPDPITDFSQVINMRYGRSVVTSNDRSVNILDQFNFAEGTIWDENDDSGVTFGENQVTETIEVTGVLGTEEVEVTIELEDPIFDNLKVDNFFVPKEYNVSFGYVLVDYEQILIRNSYLAGIVDVEKFLNTFGMEYTQGFFKPFDIEITKWEPVYEDRVDASGQSFKEISEKTIRYTTFFNGPNMQYNPAVPERSPDVIRYGGSAAANNVNNFPEKIITNNGTIINQYIAQRNLEFATAETEDDADYRMMAIEFQNIDLKSTLLNWDRKVTDQYDISIRFQDATKQAMMGIIGQFIMAKTAFNEYLLEAEAACSYNNIDGVFNDFFIDAELQRYAAAPATAPWMYAAVTYIKHLDFLLNVYGGDEAQMLLAAKDIIQNISPQTGNLSHVRAFAENMEGLYDELYSASSTIGVAMGGGDSNGNGIPDMFEPEMWDIQYTHTVATTLESTFIEDDRNEFLSAINAELERFEAAQEIFENERKAARKAARQAEKVRQREEDERLAIEAKVEYEYERIRYKGDLGCYYSVVAIGKPGTGTTGGSFWWVSPHWEDEFAEPYARSYNGYQLGEPSPYASRQRDIDKVEGIRKCRSRRREGGNGKGWNYLIDTDGDWNDESTGRNGDPFNEEVLKSKIRNSLK